EQEKVWEELSSSRSFFSDSVFPSQHQLEYVKSLLHLVSSEISLRNCQRDVVGNAVQKLVKGAYENPSVRRRGGLNGTVTFESHTNLGNVDDSLFESMEQVSISSRSRNQATRYTTTTATLP
ncbi:hypothetical protein B0J13DRAFT_460689, partial [Dactylonectria estremocensis]